MSADFAHTLGAITPEYAEAAGGEVEALAALLWQADRDCSPSGAGFGATYADDTCQFAYRAQARALLAAGWVRNATAAADAVLAEARAMCCDADTSLSHAARDEHSRVMAIAERLAAAVRGIG